MKKYIPNMYKKSIQDINYEKLKEQNIKCIMFDLDNTLLRVHKSIPRKDTVDLIKKLNKDFKVIIISNNTSESRLKTAADYLKVDYIKFAMKPFSRGFRKVKKMYNFSKDEMCLIGDQLMTDVLGGNRYGVFTILVDPLSNDELKVTGVNRFFEKRKLKKLDKKNLFKKGEYYE